MEEKKSRSINATKNFLTTILPFFAIAILGFVRVKAFITNLGEEIYAVNQIFYQIFAYLSLAEAGIGAIVVQKYYKLLIDQNKKEINNVYTASKKFLNKISMLILVLGFGLSFFLKFLTNNTLSLGYMQILMMLFLVRNLVDYFYFSPRFVIQADQKMYKINHLVNLVRISEIGLEIILLYCKVDYAYILILTIILRVILNIVINNKIFKEYPWLKKIENPNMDILKGTKNLIAYKLANIVYTNTDILVISSFLKPVQVIIYSSYNYIVKFMLDVMSVIVQAITPGFGNVIYGEDKEKGKKIFEELNSAFFALAIFSCTCIAMFIDKFIILWIGEDKLIGNISLICMIIILYHSISRKVLVSITEIKGWFKEVRNIAIVEAALNVIFSIVLVNYLEITGVLVATILSTLLTNYWLYPKCVYNKLYNENDIKYHIKYILYLVITLILSYISITISSNINITNYIHWAIFALIFTIVIGIIVLLIMCVTSKYFKSFLNKAFVGVEQIIIKKLNKKEN